MRIAYFTDTYIPQINGVANTLDKLGIYLTNKNITHMFFAPEYPRTSKVHRESPVKRFKSISFPIYPECRLSIPLYSNLARSADAFKPDIVHLTDPLGIGLMGLRYAKEKNIPIVSSFHTNFDAYLKYYKFELFEELVWSFFKWFHGFSLLNLCPSIDTLETLKSRGIGNLGIWSRGIDGSKFNPDYRSKELRSKYNFQDKIAFLYVGRLAAEKDLDILLESIKIINASYPNKAHFVFVGDGPYAKQIKEISPENVTYTGYLKGHDLATMYASCDVFAFPSSTETFGNVVMEAMASGLPVIAVNSGGVRDNVIHGYNGLMSVPRSVESFTKSIIELIKNPDMITSLGINAREHTLSKTWDKIFEKLVSDYESVLCLNPSSLEKTA